MNGVPATTKLYFGPWYRRSPYFESTIRAGCKAYDIYNKMYLPAEYDDVANEYRALNEGVTLWDVGVERTVQIAGPDADRLIDMLTCRDLTRCAVKQGKYMLVISPAGGIVNDPVLLHVDENVWWMQLADSDAGLYALGVLSSSGPRRGGHLPRRASRPGAGPACRGDAREARRRGHLRHPLLLVRAVRDRRHPGRHQPHRLVGGAGLRGEPARRHPRRPSCGMPIMAAGEEFDDPPDRPQRGPPGRGGHLQLGLRHDARRHAVPRHGARAPRRGAAAGLHRQGGPRARPPRGRRPQARRDRVRPRRALPRHHDQLAREPRRRAGRAGHGRRLVAGPRPQHRLRAGCRSPSPVPGNRIDVESEHGPVSRTHAPRSRSSTRARSGRRARCARQPPDADARPPLRRPVRAGADRPGHGAQPLLPGAALQRHGPPAPERPRRDARRQGRGRLGGRLHRGGRDPPLDRGRRRYVEGRLWDDADIPMHARLVRAGARARRRWPGSSSSTAA